MKSFTEELVVISMLMMEGSGVWGHLGLRHSRLTCRPVLGGCWALSPPAASLRPTWLLCPRVPCKSWEVLWVRNAVAL